MASSVDRCLWATPSPPLSVLQPDMPARAVRSKSCFFLRGASPSILNTCWNTDSWDKDILSSNNVTESLCWTFGEKRLHVWVDARPSRDASRFPLCDADLNYELQIIWEHSTPPAAMLNLSPARRAKSVWWRWWLVGVAFNSCTKTPHPHETPWIQIHAGRPRRCFDSRDQTLNGFSANSKSRATH